MLKDVDELSEHEVKLKSYWSDVVKHIRRDLAYIWTDEVRKDFEGIKKEVGKITFILGKLHIHYKTDKERYNKEIEDIRNLLMHISKTKPKAEWVRQVHMDLQEIIEDVEREKIEVQKPKRISRRKFLKWVLTGTAASILPIKTATAQTFQATPQITSTCRLSIDQVKSGRISPRDYLNERFKCLPEVVEAHKSGILKGFLYEPNDRELEILLAELFSTYTTDKQHIKYLIRQSIDAYRKAKTLKAHGALVPGVIGVFGRKFPLYVAFTAGSLFHHTMDKDANIRSLIKHELRHVKDFYNGIRFNNIYLSFNTITPDTIKIEFLENLAELRAYYEELRDIFYERIKTGKDSVSMGYLIDIGMHYAEKYDFILNKHSSEIERKISVLQLRDFSGIKSVKTTDRFILYFDLFGVKATFEIG